MSTEPKKSKKKLFILLIILVVLAGGGIFGSYMYQEGQEDLQKNILNKELMEKAAQEQKQRVEYLKDAIAHTNADLQLATKKLDQINDFVFLRSESKKEEQLAEQNRLIADLNEQLGKLQNELNSYQSNGY